MILLIIHVISKYVMNKISSRYALLIHFLFYLHFIPNSVNVMLLSTYIPIFWCFSSNIVSIQGTNNLFLLLLLSFLLLDPVSLLSPSPFRVLLTCTFWWDMLTLIHINLLLCINISMDEICKYIEQVKWTTSISQYSFQSMWMFCCSWHCSQENPFVCLLKHKSVRRAEL